MTSKAIVFALGNNCRMIDHLVRGGFSVKAFIWMLVGPLPHIATGWDGREKDFQRGEGRLTRYHAGEHGVGGST